jgi:hypothetical protein
MVPGADGRGAENPPPPSVALEGCPPSPRSAPVGRGPEFRSRRGHLGRRGARSGRRNHSPSPRGGRCAGCNRRLGGRGGRCAGCNAENSRGAGGGDFRKLTNQALEIATESDETNEAPTGAGACRNQGTKCADVVQWRSLQPNGLADDRVAARLFNGREGSDAPAASLVFRGSPRGSSSAPSAGRTWHPSGSCGAVSFSRKRYRSSPSVASAPEEPFARTPCSSPQIHCSVKPLCSPRLRGEFSRRRCSAGRPLYPSRPAPAMK